MRSVCVLFLPPRVQIVQMLKDEIGRRDEEALQFARVKLRF